MMDRAYIPKELVRYVGMLGAFKCNSYETIKRTYRQLLFKYHPDKNGSKDSSTIKGLIKAFAYIREQYESNYIEGNSNSERAGNRYTGRYGPNMSEMTLDELEALIEEAKKFLGQDNPMPTSAYYCSKPKRDFSQYRKKVEDKRLRNIEKLLKEAEEEPPFRTNADKIDDTPTPASTDGISKRRNSAQASPGGSKKSRRLDTQIA